MDAPAIKPIATGVMVMKALGGIKAGAWMKPALDVCMEWQLRNPGEGDPKGAIEEVLKRRKELKIPGAQKHKFQNGVALKPAAYRNNRFTEY